MAPHKILANSLPRGGPFLLAGVLELLGYAKYAGDSAGVPRALNFEEVKNALKTMPTAADAYAIDVSLFAPWAVPQSVLRGWLDSVAPGCYLMAHLAWTSELPPLLADAGYRYLTIIRNPCALFAALLFDEAVMPRFLRPFFSRLSPPQQLDFMWNGGPIREQGLVLKPFEEVYRSMLAWRHAAEGLVVRFEDLAGETESGDSASRWAAVESIAAYLGVPMNEDMAARLHLIDDPSTHAFRIDRPSEWPPTLFPELAERIRTLCEPLCCEAGYHCLRGNAA